MCGIAGILHFDQQPVDRNDLERMNAFMESRGPDHAGYYAENGVGLAHRRLSIIDLSEAGHQPMHSADQRFVICFNGEIYNFPVLKKALEEKGVIFQTKSDTEVLMEGYRVWGATDLLRRAEGMFAFVLIDKKEQKAIMARDRFGKKPLYFFRNQKCLRFASDIRSVATLTEGLTMNNRALEHYFIEMVMPQPQTVWNEINQLSPGHFCEIDLKTGKGEMQRWWAFQFAEKLEVSEEEALEEIEKRLVKSITARTIADVPIACFLSGGVDSGLIVALLAQHSDAPVNTFSVGFEEEAFNELPYAKSLAERYGTNHTELVVSADIQDLIPKIYGEMGEPFADSSIIPTYIVSKEMRQHYKVALSGDGGDELFGYPAYVWFHKVDQFLRKNKGASGQKWAVLRSKIMSRFGAENLGALSNSALNQNNGTALMREMAFSENDLSKLLQKGSTNFTREYLDKAWLHSDATSFGDRVFAGSAETRLLNDYLVKVDRASMLTSLEVRSPFLDTSLADYAFHLPNDLKFVGGEAKYLTKKLAEKHVSADISTRPKSGFSIPVGQWVKKELRDLMHDMLAPERLKQSGIFHAEKVQQIIASHESGAQDHTHRIWSMLCFELWREKYGN